VSIENRYNKVTIVVNGIFFISSTCFPYENSIETQKKRSFFFTHLHSSSRSVVAAEEFALENRVDDDEFSKHFEWM
jgi:hypothetical protein